MNCIAKKQKAVKGLKFSDRQNNIDHAISTGVGYESSSPIVLSEHTGNLDDAAQLILLIIVPTANLSKVRFSFIIIAHIHV